MKTGNSFGTKALIQREISVSLLSRNSMRKIGRRKRLIEPFRQIIITQSVLTFMFARRPVFWHRCNNAGRLERHDFFNLCLSTDQKSLQCPAIA